MLTSHLGVILPEMKKNLGFNTIWKLLTIFTAVSMASNAEKEHLIPICGANWWKDKAIAFTVPGTAAHLVNHVIKRWTKLAGRRRSLILAE